MARALHLLGLHHPDVLYPVGEVLPQHVDVELVALLHLVKVGEQLLRRQSTMPRKHAVRRFAAHRQARARQVPDALVKHLARGAVIHRQPLANLGDVHIGHGLHAGNRQLAQVLRIFRQPLPIIAKWVVDHVHRMRGIPCTPGIVERCAFSWASPASTACWYSEAARAYILVVKVAVRGGTALPLLTRNSRTTDRANSSALSFPPPTTSLALPGMFRVLRHDGAPSRYGHPACRGFIPPSLDDFSRFNHVGNRFGGSQPQRRLALALAPGA